MLKISSLANPIVSKAILITGSARSGTTIMGKVISSLEKVEYAYEPPMLYTLFALIDSMEKEQWKLFYETYLYEEFLMNVLSGRSFNFNRKDDSTIVDIKTSEEIERRLNLNLSKAEAEIIAPAHVLAYKMPDVVSIIPKLKEYYPRTKIVVMLRDATETINSILKKKWFSDQNVRKSLIWPFREYNGIRVPYWVKQDDDELWACFSELDRAAYYYIRVNQEVNNIPDRIEISYEHLISRPYQIISRVVSELGLEFGERTEEIIKKIKPTSPERDNQIINRIDPMLKESVLFYSNLAKLMK